MPRHVALLLNNPFTADSRSWKLATSLAAAGFRVTVVARAASGLPGREERDGYTVLRIEQPRPLRWLPAPPLPGREAPAGGLATKVRNTAGRAAQAFRYLLLARAWADRIAREVPAADIWQSEGLITLPVALRLRERLGGRVVYDSRDVHVESARFARLPGPWRRLLARRERRWARAADAVVTVSTAYAAVLERMLGVRPAIVWNGPVSWDVPDPRPRLLHERLGLRAGTPVVLHLGALQPHRGIEELIDAMAFVDRAALAIVGDGPLREALENRARQTGHGDRVRFLGAAPPAEILPLTASADVSVVPIHGSTVNHRLTTPTKLFDAMGAGTPVVASDLPGMAPIVRDTGCGVLCDPTSPADLARAIREILDAPPERRAALAQAGLRAASTTYGWHRQVQVLLDVYAGLGVTPGGDRSPSPRLRVTMVAANTVEHDSRLRRSAWALAQDGHAVTIVGFAAPGLPAEERFADGVLVRRVELDRRIASAFRPLPEPVRGRLASLLGIDPDAVVLPPASTRGLARVLAPLRRVLEIASNLRRVGVWREAVLEVAGGAHVYHAKALVALPVVRSAARRTGARFVYDVADFHSEAARLSRMPAVVRRLVRLAERRWVRDASGLTAVSEAVATEVASRYGVERPALLLNAPFAWRPDEPGVPADDGRLRAATRLPAETSIVLYQGALSVDRGIEELVASLDEPPLRTRDVAVVLLGFGRLRDGLAAEAARRPGRLVLLDPVPPEQLVGYTVGADISYVGQPPRTLNQRMNLANKLFESMMAGVPVVVAEGTEHCRFVTRERVGVCADVDRPRAIAAALVSLLDASPEERAALRAHCRTLGLTRYSWEDQRAGIVELYRRIAATPAR